VGAELASAAADIGHLVAIIVTNLHVGFQWKRDKRIVGKTAC
jgi:hypothetical protein